MTPNPNLEPPRWPGSPPICVSENLPAFTDKQALKKFHAEQCALIEIVRVWQCPRCAHWHFKAGGKHK